MKKIDPFLLTILDRNITKLPLDIWLEDCLIKWNIKHNPYKILIPNKYRKYYLKKSAWISIDKNNPKLISSKKVKIKKEDIEKIMDYVKKHYNDFTMHIELKESDYMIHLKLSPNIDDQKEYKNFQIKNDHIYLKMFKEMFSNACTILPEITKLEVNIYSLHNGIYPYKYYKPKIKIGLKNKYFIVVVLEKEPIIIYQTLGITKEEQNKCKKALEYVLKNSDLFLKHYNDSKNNFLNEDLINSLNKKNINNRKMIH